MGTDCHFKYAIVPLLFVLLVLFLQKSSALQTTISAAITKQDLIIAIRNLEKNIFLMDESELESYFKFPISDENIWFASAAPDSIFINTVSHTILPFTEFDFRNYCSKIFMNPDSGFLRLFKNLEIDSLKNKNEISKQIYPDSNSCYYLYEIRLNELINEIEFSFGTNTNGKFSNEESWCHEYLFSCIFKYADQKFIFKKLLIAG